MQCSGAGCAMIKEGCLNAWGSLSCIWWTQIRLSGPSLIGKYIYFSSIQAFSTVSPKLFFLLCKISIYVKKKEIYKKSTQNIMKHCPEICAKSWKSISLFFDTDLKLLHWTQICKLLEFHPCPSESSCRISISSNLEALVTSQSYCIWFETEWKCAERKVWDLSWKWTTSSFMVLL